MKKLLVIVCVISLMLGISACHPMERPRETDPASLRDVQVPTALQPMELQSTQPQETTPMPTEPKPSDPPADQQPSNPDPMVAAMQELLGGEGNQTFYNDALLSNYATPSDINLFYLFYDGFRDVTRDATDAEVAYLNTQWISDWVYADLDILPVEKMDAVLMEMFGISLAETKGVGLESFAYFEDMDCYYHAHTGTHYATITVTQVKKLFEGTIEVYYLRGHNQNEHMVATLIPKGNGYQIRSNLPELEYLDSEEREVIQIAEEVVRRYKMQRNVGICCDYEDVGYEDMSRFLTAAQKEEYFDYQYRLLCCHTVEEVRAHIDRLMDASVKPRYPDDKLFTDNAGNLYLIVIPTDTAGYRVVQLLEYSPTHIVVNVELSDLSGAFGIETLTLQLIDGEFSVASVEQERWDT